MVRTNIVSLIACREYLDLKRSQKMLERRHREREIIVDLLPTNSLVLDLIANDGLHDNHQDDQYMPLESSDIEKELRRESHTLKRPTHARKRVHVDDVIFCLGVGLDPRHQICIPHFCSDVPRTRSPAI